MPMVAYLIVAALVLAALFFGIRYFVRAYYRYRDSRIIICPDSKEQAMVEVDAVHAALTSVLGQPDIRLRNCWRWPLHENCGQECLAQLDVAPEECLVRGMLMRWYDFKSCFYCGKPFHQIHLLEHKPALRTPEGKLLEWKNVPIADIEMVMRRYSPVCWDCYIAQSFRRDHPEMVVYRPWREGIPRGDGTGHQLP